MVIFIPWDPNPYKKSPKKQIQRAGWVLNPQPIVHLLVIS